MTKDQFISDIPTESARSAFHGVSWQPEARGDRQRDDYAAQLAEDYETLKAQAVKGQTLDLLDAEFSRYRSGMRARTLKYLASSARCVSCWIVGRSNFPAARMNKRADVTHKRLGELLDFRSRALAAIRRKLRPDLAPIYAGDSDALERLQAKIVAAEALQARMRETNSLIRRNAKHGQSGQIQALMLFGYAEGTARRLLEPDFCGRIGFADYQLTNNNANIRRMKQRMEQIEDLKASKETEASGENATVEEKPAENRVRLFFPGKPDESVRSDLKRNGFRWTPTLGCWQAYFNTNTCAIARRIAGVESQQQAA